MNFKRIVYIILIILLAIIVPYYLGKTYSRFESNSLINANTNIAKWDITLKDGMTELENKFNIKFISATDNNGNVGQNKFAPGTSGQAKLILDFTDTEVSVDYNITVDTKTLEKQIGSSNITLTVLDNNNQTINFGKDTYIPLVNGEKFTNENGIYTFTFNLKWDNNLDNNNLSDSSVVFSYDTLTLPVSVKIKQHIEELNNEVENKKVTSNISYVETTETKQREKQALNYTFDEQDILHSNPEKGFYSSSPITLNENGLASGSTITKSNTSSLLYLKIDLSAFSGSMNGTGKDKELTDKAIGALENILEKIKQNDNTVILRFVYDNNATGVINGIDKVEPAQEMLLKHISKLSSTFQKYANTINIIQTGFYGLWGEAYYNTDATKKPEYYQQTIQALLNATKGTQITIAVRTPEYYSWYKGVDIENIDDEKNITTSADDAYRVGIFNDAYGGSENDLGTYHNRQKETNWMMHQTSHTYYGGEAIPDVSSANATNGIGPYNTAMYFIQEALKLHTSYINWEWNQELHKEWAKQIYTGDDPYYYGKPALTYIENHLGYRFVVKEVRTYEIAESKETLPIDITINNVGFANVIKEKQSDIVITDVAGNIVKTYSNVNIDAKDFISQTTIKKSVSIDLPELSAGEYKIYLRFSSGEKLNNGSYYSAIRFANNNMYSDTLQANYIARFTVK